MVAELGLLLRGEQHEEVEGAGHAVDEREMGEQRQPPPDDDLAGALREGAVEVDPPQCEAQDEGEREDTAARDGPQVVEGLHEAGEALAEDDEDEEAAALAQVVDAQDGAGVVGGQARGQHRADADGQCGGQDEPAYLSGAATR